jgi:hypothetical protein
VETIMNGRTWAVLLGVLAAAVAALALMTGKMGPSIAWGGAPHVMWGYGGPNAAPMMSPNPWIWMGLAGLALVGFWLALFIGVLLVGRWFTHWPLQVPARMENRSTESLVTLQQRYAAGEFDQATYDRLKRDLAA